MDSAGPAVTHSTPHQLSELFCEYSRAAEGTAQKNRAKGDEFGEALAKARADVYQQAANLVRTQSLADALAAMLERAKASHVKTPPLIDFERAGVRYIMSRAWQFCAMKINPSVTEVAAKWD
jgi:preprotein translocase subunit SecA